MPYSDGILEVYLAINYAAYQSMAGGEQTGLVLDVLSLVLRILLVRWEIHSTKFGLDYETSFVRVHSKIDFDRELNAVRLVKLFKQLLFISSKTYITIFLCLNNCIKLESSATLT